MGTSVLTTVLRMQGVVGKISIKSIDRGLDRIKKTLREIKRDRSYVKAGLIGNGKRRKGDSLSNVQLGLIHEFGTATIPARPFVSSAFRAHRSEYVTLLHRLARGIYMNKVSYPVALKLIGQKMAADIKNGVTQGSGIPPPNSPETYRRKLAKGRKKLGTKEGPIGEPRALVDTGQMIGAVTYEVVTKGGK